MMILLKNVVKNSNLVPRLTFNFSNQNSSRHIFSAKFHDIDLLKDREAKQKLLISDIDFFKKNIKDNYEKHGIKNIFDEELLQAIVLTSNDMELKLAQNLILDFLSDELRYEQKQFNKLLKFWYRKCFTLNSVDLAQSMWTNSQVQKVFALNSVKNNRLYFDLLFINEMYDKILEEFLNDVEKYSQEQDVLLIVSLSCYKQNTKDSLEMCMKHVIPNISASRIVTARAIKVAALLAYNLGEYAVAQSLVKKQNAKKQTFNENMELLILIAVGRIDQAVNMFQARMMPKPHFTYPEQIMYSTVEALMKAVRDQGDKDLQNQMMEMVVAIDKSEVAEIVSYNLEDMILMELEPASEKPDLKRTRYKRLNRDSQE